MQPLALHSRHESLGAAFGEAPGQPPAGSPGGRQEAVVLGYGAPEAEYAAATGAAALWDGSSRELLRLTGEERVSFLQGMVTQDVEGLPEGGLAYTALLTVKGAMVADAHVLKRPGELLLDVEPGQGARVLEFLNRHLISEDAELQDVSAQWGQLWLLGPRAEAVAQEALETGVPAPGRVSAVPFRGHGLLVGGTGPWEGAAPPGGKAAPAPPHALTRGVRVWAPTPVLGELFDHLLAKGRPHGLLPLGLLALEALRVEAGVPRFGADMDEHTIPLEANLERALHYNKGCYIGQEVIARATFRGHMNRKLVGLHLGSASPAPRTELRVGERKAGWVTSVVHSPALGQHVALGYVHRDFLTPGTALSLAGAPEAKAVVAALPLVPRP